MAIGINDLDDDDVVYSQQPATEGTGSNDDDNFLFDYLKTRGIDDPSKINFEDDNGQITQRNWNDLSKEEKFNIINTPLEEPQVNNNQPNYQSQFTDDELRFISQLRQNNMTPEQYIQSLTKEEEPRYKVDDLSDDELYLLDLEARVGELSEDEAVQALSLAKQNEDFYKKQVDGIRKEYKEKEDFKTQQEQATREQEEQAAYQNYSNNVIEAINNFKSIGNLDLNMEDSDKEELAQFMLSLDNNGQNYLYQALQEPETLTKAAWFILNGEEAFDNITDYFKNQIKLISENQYKKGFEDGKKGTSSKPELVINKNNNKSYRTIKDINDLDDDD